MNLDPNAMIISHNTYMGIIEATKQHGTWHNIVIVYCLQFYIHLGLESPLDERQIMEDRLSSRTDSMPQTWPGRPCL
jgi:hypothetical protein